MEATREFEETLRALARLLSEPTAKQWRKRVENYADQIASGNISDTSNFLAMYRGGMGSFLDLQGSTAELHQELVALRDRVYDLASGVERERARLAPNNSFKPNPLRGSA
jgi:hypothetical protein